jgi:23S rRNA-/tRNA-specific pseudouridylate synthase
MPKTGRYRQIRQHCNFLGHPIVGDGTEFDNTDKITHICLLAARYFFPRVPLNFICPLTPWLQDLQNEYPNLPNSIEFIKNINLHEILDEKELSTN